MKRIDILLVTFSTAFAAFLVGPAFLPGASRIYPLFSRGDVLDLLTPMVLLPLYGAIARSGAKAPRLRDAMIFLVFAAFWVEGQGMHLAANAVGHMIQTGTADDLARLTYALDEILSHYLWHIGVAGLWGLLIVLHRDRVPEAPWRKVQVGMAGVVYGMVYFLITVEAQTAPLGVPFALAVLGVLLSRWRRAMDRPVLVYSLVASGAAVALFLGWGIYWRGLPEFSQVGIIQ